MMMFSITSPLSCARAHSNNTISTTILMLVVLLLIGHDYVKVTAAAASAVGAGEDPPPPPMRFYHELLSELGAEAVAQLRTQAGESVNCTHAFAHRSPLQREAVWPPPHYIPKDLLRYFSLNGSVPIAMSYQPHNSFREESHFWKDSVIQEMISGKDANDFCAGQRRYDCHKRLKRRESAIRGRAGLVVGSEYPWAEALLVRMGAARLLTLEKIRTELQHPQMRATTPSELAAAYLRGAVPALDFALSFSYVEHQGLGKEGEGLDPWADTRLMRHVLCLLRPGALFFLAVPIGPDALHWNTYRTYGARRLPLLLRGWELVDVLGNFTAFRPRDPPTSLAVKGSSSRASMKAAHKQPILVLRKPLLETTET